MTTNPNVTPVVGYVPQPQWKLDEVNTSKRLEEALLQRMESYLQDPEIDKRWVAIARTHIEQGFMALNRAILQPERVKL
jgi:hypothetical protein